MSHDYDPKDDYAVVLPTAYDGEVVAKAIDEASLKLRRALDLGPLTIFCVEPGGFSNRDGETGGIYVEGTSNAPVIGLDLEAIKADAEEQGVSWEDELRATVCRNLAHAYRETLGLKIGDQEAAEEFARIFVQENIVDVDFLRHSFEAPSRHSRSARR